MIQETFYQSSRTLELAGLGVTRVGHI
jgi:hypothetical protein